MDPNLPPAIQETLHQVWVGFLGHLPFLVVGLIALLVTWIVSIVLRTLFRRALRGWRARASLKDLVTRLLSIAVWCVGLLVTAMILFPGLTPARALGGLGLVSIAVGLAFKDIFENFFAGILMLWRFPFENGDYIKCGDIEGEVTEILVRMTQIRRTTGELVIVPNSYLFKNPVEVLTYGPARRTSIVSGVAYGEDVARAVNVIEKAVQGCEGVLGDRPVQVFPMAFGASSVDIEVAWWTGPKPIDIRRSRGEVVTAIKHDLDEAGIEIPFPYRTLTFNDPIPVALDGGPKQTLDEG